MLLHLTVKLPPLIATPPLEACDDDVGKTVRCMLFKLLVLMHYEANAMIPPLLYS